MLDILAVEIEEPEFVVDWDEGGKLEVDVLE